MTHLRHGRPHRIRGWGLIRARNARLPQRRYMRLIHYTLTVFDCADENASLVILEEILVGAQISIINRRREIIIKLPNDRMTVQLRTEKEFDAWSRAFSDAARIATDYYKIVSTRELGSGAFSTVFFGFDREDGHHVAIKIVDKSRCSRAELTYAETEARMMAYVRHNSIIQCRDIFDAPNVMHVIMEYMSDSTLEHRMLVNPMRFTEDVAAIIMSHLLSALAYLESEGICHRDVKPDNILLSHSPDELLWPTTARLSDFGLSAFVESETELIDVVGTPHYVAPEVVTRDESDEFVGYGPSVDVWAAGILMYWMLTGGQYPFDGEDPPAIFRSIRAAKLDLDVEAISSASDSAKSLIRGMLNPSPWTRLRASGAVVHPWLNVRHAASSVARLARHVNNGPNQQKKLSVRGKFRAAVMAIFAMRALRENINEEVRNCRRRNVKSVGPCIELRPTKSALEAKMTRAPERPPIGADALGYNIGLFPSFTPKRRAKAGIPPVVSITPSSTGVSFGNWTSGTSNASSGCGGSGRTSTEICVTGPDGGDCNSEGGLSMVRGERFIRSRRGFLGSNGAKSSRTSKDSGESRSSGTRTPSGELALTSDRKNMESGVSSLKASAWGLIRGKTSRSSGAGSFIKNSPSSSAQGP